MPYKGDIKLDADGNTVLSDNKIDVTTSNLEFVIRNLRYGPNSFKMDPTMGFGIDRYIGEQNDSALQEKIKREIEDYFSLNSILVSVNLVSISLIELGGRIDIISEDQSIVFVFNLESGIFDIKGEFEEEAPEAPETQDPTNKYLSRRT